MKTTLLWFRRDLRLHDNKALDWACENSECVLPIYIHAAEEEQPWAPGSASRWWLHNSLLKLDKQLQSYGLCLHFFAGTSHEILSTIIKESDATALVFNKLYEPHLYQRDKEIERRLRQDIKILSFDSGLFFKPGSLLNQQQLPYRVFTPFYKKARPLLDTIYNNYSAGSVEQKLRNITPARIKNNTPLNKLALLDQHQWHEKLHKYWTPGEINALTSIEHFLDVAISNYENNRDLPATRGTSQLSPCLHFGEITPQQAYLSMQAAINGVHGNTVAKSAEVFLKQVLWREFAHHVLWHFPDTTRRPMNPRFKLSFWQMNKKYLTAWTKGETGIAIVDAGMKQLWETGWMHNRVRMIVSSFLTKNLGINWTHGAHWFWDTLVDADLANNSMGWQWVAGCGVDAAPYYRIFNPVTQTRRFDSKLKYIKQWAPEYIVKDNIAPIVNLADSRNIALERYKQNIIDQDTQ